MLISGDMVLPRISTNVSVHEVEPESNPLMLYLDSIKRMKALPAETLVFDSMNERLETAIQLIAFAAFVAAILIIVVTSLTSVSAQCTRGTPFLPEIFPCFAGR